MVTHPSLSVSARRSLRIARVRRFLVNRLLDLLLLVLVLLIIAPILFLLVNSFKSNTEFTSASALLPREWRWQNYPEMWQRVHFGEYFANSLIICGATTIITTFLASLTGYALARFRFPGADLFGITALGTQLIPGTLFFIPLFLTFNWVRVQTGIPLTGSNVSGIILYTGFFLPLSLWMLRGFFAAIPPDLEEQAMVDGATRFQAFTRIVLPLASPGIIAAGIYVFLTAWDELLFAWVLNVKTIPVAVRLFTGAAGSQSRYELMSAAAVVVTLPVAVLFFLVQRRLIQGLTAGAVK